jgi:hypothetical protein
VATGTYFKLRSISQMRQSASPGLKRQQKFAKERHYRLSDFLPDMAILVEVRADTFGKLCFGSHSFHLLGAAKN